MHHPLPWNRRRHDRSIRRPLHLFDRIHRRQPYNRCAILHHRIDGPFNRRRIDQRPHRIMHQHHIVLIALQRHQRIPHRLLTIAPTLHHMHPRPQIILEHLSLQPVPLLRPHRHANRGHPRHRKKRPHRPNQHRHATNLKKLLRRSHRRPTRGHPRSDTCCWKDHKNSHNLRSIQEDRPASFLQSFVQVKWYGRGCKTV